MTPTRINVTEVARNLSDILNRVRYQGKSFDIQRGKEVVARLGPVDPGSSVDASRLPEVLASLPPLSEEELREFGRDLEKLRKTVVEKNNPWE